MISSWRWVNNHACKIHEYLAIDSCKPGQARSSIALWVYYILESTVLERDLFKIQVSFIYFSLWHGSWSSGSSRDPLNFGIWTSINQWMWQFSPRRTTPNKATHRSGIYDFFPFFLRVLLWLLLIFCCSERLWNYILTNCVLLCSKQAVTYNFYFFHTAFLVTKALNIKL